jgi:RecA-family ATPase
MDKLAPKLIRRAQKKKYAAVIIDPIYKIITGDENSADQMAHFCNQFDKVCTEVGCAVIYCHHHSKGTQSGKRSMDRASGSGVFARDPDAMLDISELFITDAVKRTEENNLVCSICLDWITRFYPDFRKTASQDDMQSAPKMREHAHTLLKAQSYELMCRQIDSDTQALSKRTAWRIEGILREFEPFAPVNCWFSYPTHQLDLRGTLKDMVIEDAAQGFKKNLSQFRQSPEEKKQEKMNDLETAFGALTDDKSDRCDVKELAGYLGVTEKTITNRLKDHPRFWVKGGVCGLK